ncbi:hypothetical protein D1AOALGA4SA_9039 [Olavius algarvensis Delta 1 endosymbiont]|nr:hypothetical protein D1AOALGA4SA_9039 [Olavius algarvensis Delta 1 endosymbiont]
MYSFNFSSFYRMYDAITRIFQRFVFASLPLYRQMITYFLLIKKIFIRS